MKAVEIGKNKYNNNAIRFIDKEGNETLYRLYCKCTTKTLEIITEIIEASYTRELTVTENSILVKAIWIVYHHDTESANSKLAGIKSISTCCLNKENVTINCGGRKCMECLKAEKNCYFRNTTFNIKELLK